MSFFYPTKNCKSCKKKVSEKAETCPHCGINKPGRVCFVATAAFGDYDAPEVIYLSDFRDNSLSRSVFGRGFIRAYNAISPYFANIIAKSDFLRLAVRKTFLQPMIFLLERLRKK